MRPIRKIRSLIFIGSTTFLCSNLAFGAPIESHFGLIHTNGKVTGIDPGKLKYPRWRYAEHLVAKNTSPILKDGELEWGSDGFEVSETAIDGSSDPQRRRRKFYHKLERQQSLISQDGQRWYPLGIKVLNTKPTIIGRFLMRVMVIEFSSEIFSAAYDVFDYHYGHHKH